MNAILNSLQTVGLILFIIALGYFMCIKKWLIPSEHNGFIAKTASFLAMPCVMFGAIFNGFDKKSLIEAMPLFALVLVSHLIVYACAAFIAKKWVPVGKRGIFTCVCTIGNTVFMGFPVCAGIFGEQSLHSAATFSIITIILFWSLSYIGLCRDAGHKLTPIDIIKKLFNPAIIAGILACIFVLLGVELPYIVTKSVDMLGSLGTPLGLLFIGSIMYSMGLKNIKLDTYLNISMVLRFFVSPAITAILMAVFGIGGELFEVFIIQSAMPAMIFLAVTASLVGADEKAASTAVIATTMASLVFIPIYVTLLAIF